MELADAVVRLATERQERTVLRAIRDFILGDADAAHEAAEALDEYQKSPYADPESVEVYIERFMDAARAEYSKGKKVVTPEFIRMVRGNRDKARLEAEVQKQRLQRELFGMELGEIE